MTSEKEKERCRKKAMKQFYDRKKSCMCVSCNKVPPVESFTKCEACNIKHNKKNMTLRAKQKLEAFSQYGGAVCACCGETEFSFLQLDHIHGGGYKHRQEIGGGSNIFTWLKKNNYPEGFQVLCANCNWGKHINGGICPHHDRPFVITETDYAYE